MIRPVHCLRIAATMLAGGSFLLFPTQATPAEPTGSAEVAGVDASLAISPLRLELDRAANGATVYLTNSSTTEVAVQTRIFAWSQEDGSDTYAPSADLTVSPSISMIPPGETQIVRVLRKGAASPGEKRFRLAVDQLPDPSRARAGQASARIRFTLPVFVDRDTAAPASLAWRMKDDRIELANNGGATARVVSISVKSASGEDVSVAKNTLRYVQGNSTISWPVGKGCSLGSVHITAQIDGQTVDAQPISTCG